jgi:hypothetical protein
MHATHEAELDIPAPRKETRRVDIVPALAGKTLLSVGQLTRAECTVTFDGTDVKGYHNGKVVMTGNQMQTNLLWRMEYPIINEIVQSHEANATIHFNTAAEIVRFTHAALGYLPLATLDKALSRGYLSTFPGLTQKLLRAHPPFNIATPLGHMMQSRKNMRSTKRQKQEPLAAPTQLGEKTNSVPQDRPAANKLQWQWRRRHCRQPPHKKP